MAKDNPRQVPWLIILAIGLIIGLVFCFPLYAPAQWDFINNNLDQVSLGITVVASILALLAIIGVRQFNGTASLFIVMAFILSSVLWIAMPVQAVTLDANFTYDPDPATGTAPLTVDFTDISQGGGLTGWMWDFGDGGVSALQHPSHTYTTPGIYSVMLTVSKGGQVNTELKTNLVTVTPGIPPVDPPPGELPGNYTFYWYWDDNSNTWIYNTNSNIYNVTYDNDTTVQVQNYDTTTITYDNDTNIWQYTYDNDTQVITITYDNDTQVTTYTTDNSGQTWTWDNSTNTWTYDQHWTWDNSTNTWYYDNSVIQDFYYNWDNSTYVWNNYTYDDHSQIWEMTIINNYNDSGTGGETTINNWWDIDTTVINLTVNAVGWLIALVTSIWVLIILMGLVFIGMVMAITKPKGAKK